MNSGAGAESAAGKRASGRTKLLDWPFSRLLMLGGMIFQLAAIVAFVGPSPGNAVFVLPFIAPLLVLCSLAIAKGRPWMYLGGGISLVIFPVLVALFSADSFVNPLLGLVFASALLLVLGALLGLPAGIWVFRHRKGEAAGMTAREGLKTRYGVVTVLLAGALLGAAVAGEAAHFFATSTVTSSGSDFVPQGNVTITAENFFFTPANVSIASGKIIEVTVVNKDNALHTFTYTVYKGTADEKTYSHNLLPSSTTKFTMLVSTPGTVHFWCVPHESMGMFGDFQVS